VAHRATTSTYKDLAERINMFPQGAPPTDRLFKILALLFDEREAAIVARLPVVPFSLKRAARTLKMSELETRKTLDELAVKGLLIDVNHNGSPTYVLPPPMAGFFEMSMMRIRDDIDQRELAGLFHEYINEEDDFITALFSGETKLGRALINEAALAREVARVQEAPPAEQAGGGDDLHVLDYERASHIVESASARAVVLCYCRHKMQHLDKACAAPLQICMAFNAAGDYLIRRGYSRTYEASEMMALLDQAYEHNLVQFGENGRERVNFICNCCGCCCEAMVAAREFAHLHPVHTTAFLPAADETACNGCGTCVTACPVAAVAVGTAGLAEVAADGNGGGRAATGRSRETAQVDVDRCLGCGICVRVCTRGAMRLHRRAQRVITPLNSAHRAVVMAIERGMLQNLVFSDPARAGHRSMAAILGVILRLPPAKQALASRQMKSRYLEALIARKKPHGV
jgi:ferredoxin